jgi:hypothetical protein
VETQFGTHACAGINSGSSSGCADPSGARFFTLSFVPYLSRKRSYAILN